VDEKQYRSVLRRRDFLRDSACGLGMIALSQLLSSKASAAAGDVNPLAAKPGHFPARAKNVIFLFMEGGPSQLDLFDPKPALAKLDGAPLPESMRQGLRFAFIKPTAKVWASKRQFRQHGASGMSFSDLVPNLASCADDLCMVRSMYSDQFNHHPGQLLLHCGSPLVGRPALGSWLLYGLGSESQNLPGFVVLSSGRGSSGSSGLFSNGFLPSMYQGVPFSSSGDPIPYLSNPHGITREGQRARLDVIRKLNELRQQETGDREIASRIASYELAFRMQTAGPELLDFAGESPSTLEAYGVDKEPTAAFGKNCLMARRLVERGVRFVLVSHASWDDHASLESGHKKNCQITDQPSAALIRDLKQRGLLKDTIVVWGGEFGRTPLSQTTAPGHEDQTGRDHHPDAFTMLLAGGGIKPGTVTGQTDDLGMKIAEDKVHIHDLHATILHCLGLDHLQLTYRHQGRNFRLTDVAGNVVHKMLA
jgi:hypothetical protein